MYGMYDQCSLLSAGNQAVDLWGWKTGNRKRLVLMSGIIKPCSYRDFVIMSELMCLALCTNLQYF